MVLKMKNPIQHLIFEVNTPNISAIKAPQSIHADQASRLLTYPELKLLKGIPYSRQHLYRLEKAGEFPLRIQISPGRIAWYEHEIDEHLKRKASTRN